LDGIWQRGNSSGLQEEQSAPYVQHARTKTNRPCIYQARDDSHGQASRLEQSKPGRAAGRAYPLTNGRAEPLYLECGDNERRWRLVTIQSSLAGQINAARPTKTICQLCGWLAGPHHTALPGVPRHQRKTSRKSHSAMRHG